jgi:TPR repeat protein
MDKPENDKVEPDAAATSNSEDQVKAEEEKAAKTESPSSSTESASANASTEDSSPSTKADVPDARTAEESSSKAATASKKPEPPVTDHQYDAQVDQAERYLRGQGVAQNCSRAISLLRSSAREGNPRAQVKLGALYATGQCVTQDRAAAYQWLARAQETQPHNSYLQRTMNNLWSNMTPEERDRITR